MPGLKVVRGRGLGVFKGEVTSGRKWGFSKQKVSAAFQVNVVLR